MPGPESGRRYADLGRWAAVRGEVVETVTQLAELGAGVLQLGQSLFDLDDPDVDQRGDAAARCPAAITDLEDLADLGESESGRLRLLDEADLVA